MLTVDFRFDENALKQLVNVLEKNLPENIDNSLLDYARDTADVLRNNAITDELRTPTPRREMAAARIRAKKISKFHSAIYMPKSLVYLDSMEPHYVSLKRGRAINKWVGEYFGTQVITSNSRVTTTRGGFKGAIYVSPHRFITRSLHSTRKHLPNKLREGITKAFSKEGTVIR